MACGNASERNDERRSDHCDHREDLVPASPAVKAAAAKQQDDYDDDKNCCHVHCFLRIKFVANARGFAKG